MSPVIGTLEEMYLHYVFGASLSHVGRRFGISGSLVKQRFSQAGLAVRDADAATRLYNTGGNEIADERLALYLESSEEPVSDEGPRDHGPSDDETPQGD